MWPKSSKVPASKRKTLRKCSSGPSAIGRIPSKTVPPQNSSQCFCLFVPNLQTRARVTHVPPRRRATDKRHGTARIFAAHATEFSKAVVFALAHYIATRAPVYGVIDYDKWNTAQVLAKTNFLSKNKAAVFLHCIARGAGQKFNTGGRNGLGQTRPREMLYCSWYRLPTLSDTSAILPLRTSEATDPFCPCRSITLFRPPWTSEERSSVGHDP